MITVSLEKPLPFEQDGGGRVEVVAFDIRPPTWADEKVIRKAGKGIDFDAVMLRLSEPVGAEIDVNQPLLDRLTVWDVSKLQAAFAPFFTHPDTLSPEQRKTYGLSAKQS